LSCWRTGREPKLSPIDALAQALSVSTAELLRQQPPSRAQLEIVAQAQQDLRSATWACPTAVGAGCPPTLEHIVALHTELRRQRVKPTATPEEAREANADLRA
jgi:hypothetical protein